MAVEVLLGVGAAASLLAGGRHLIHKGLAPGRLARDRTPADLQLAYEEVVLPTANGKSLAGWLVPPAGASSICTKIPAVTLIHGWGGNAATMLPLVRPLHEAGFAVLLFDARCHGDSDGDSFTSLPRFAEDLDHVLHWLEQRPEIDGSRHLIVGHSVGAGAALLVASRRTDVAGVVSLAAFSHPEAMMRRWLQGRHIPHVPIGWMILRYVERTIGRRFADIAPVNTIRDVCCPVLIVHGAEDETVPVTEAEQIFAAAPNGKAQLRVVPGSHDDFGDEVALQPEVAAVARFLKSCIDGRRGQ